jgi:hypothetical protein
MPTNAHRKNGEIKKLKSEKKGGQRQKGLSKQS